MVFSEVVVKLVKEETYNEFNVIDFY